MAASLAEPPLFAALRNARNVLIAGAGGGFDFYAGLPLAFALSARGTKVHLANLSFSPLELLDFSAWLEPGVAAIRPGTGGFDDYFPERTLARWLAREFPGIDPIVYAFQLTGVDQLRAAYAALTGHLGVDAVVLVDGGTDILMRGDEWGVGSPAEDMTSLAAVVGLTTVPTKLVTCLGFGIDAHDGVHHTQVLENLAALDRDGGYLGALSIPSHSTEARLYRSAVADVQAATAVRPSIVQGQIAAAVAGEFGDVQFTDRTAGSALFVNPLMAVYFTVDAAALAARNLVLDRLEGTGDLLEVAARIDEFRLGVTRRPAQPFPH